MAYRVLIRRLRPLLPLLLLASLPTEALAQRKVREAVFEGNEAFSDRQLRRVVNVDNPANFILLRPILGSKPRFNYLVLGRDVTYLRAFYRNRGYLQVRVEHEVEQLSGEELMVRFRITEGSLTTLSHVRLEGNRLFTDEALLAVLRRARGARLRPERGDPVSEAAIRAGAEAIIQRYRTEGRYFAGVEPTIGQRDTLNGTAPVVFRVTEGPEVRVGGVRIEGNRDTKGFVISREVTLEPGDRMTETERRESQRWLYATGIFRTVNVTVGEISPDSTLANVLVTVSESPRRYVGTGIGVVSDQQEQFDLSLRGSAEWGHRNLYGTGRALQLTASADFQIITRWSQVRRELGLRYIEPWFWGARTPLTASFTLRPQSYQEYQVQEIVSEIGWRREFTPRTRGWINFSYRLINTQIPIEAFSGRDALRGVTGDIERDSRDNILSPNQGSLSRLSGSLYGLLGLGGPQYSLISFSWARYQPTGLHTILATRVRFGAALPLGPTDEVPIFDRFFLGGAYSVRGFDERLLGPVTAVIDSAGAVRYSPRGGQAMALLNVGVRRPRILGPLGMLVFFDAGNVWADLDEVDTRLALTAGAGIFLDTPIGPIRFDYGWRLNRSATERDTPGYRLPLRQWHLGVLYAF